MRRQLYTLLLLCMACLLKGQDGSVPVARYSFNNGSAGDDPVRAYGAKLTDDRFGNENSAYYLQGNADSYINLGTSQVLKPLHGSISLWVKINQPIYKGGGIEHNPIIYTKARIQEDFNEGFYIGYHLGLKNINACVARSELEQITLYPTKETALLQWHHVVITFDSTSLCLYLDGILENKAAKHFENSYLPGDSILVGRISSRKNNRYLNACVDDIEIYDRVLSPYEVSQLYAAPNPNKNALFIKWALAAVAAALLVFMISWLVKRRVVKLVNIEKNKNQLQNNWYEQENRVLTAQMDPHFIFNSLNTIQQFIIVNENDKAQEYLSRFSKLLRKLLESNTKESITLKEEIAIYENYLAIESIRFNNVFTYSISVKGTIDPGSLHIPHFLIQPVIENSIWHGLLPKEGEKELTIVFEKRDEDTLSCTVEDNGVGRQHTPKTGIFEKKKSFALAFIAQRLQVMSRMKGAAYGIEIIDKTGNDGQSTGTKVIVTLPILNHA